jgi:hypothetical protein
MTKRSSRRRFLGIVGGSSALALAGCVDALTSNSDAREDAIKNTDGDPSAIKDLADVADETALPLRESSVPLSTELGAFERNAVSGGVSKDAIPSIDDPQFAGIAYGDENMDPGDPVFGVELEGDARAYPQYILVRHEIVNDEFGDQGVTVSYCPLTGSAIGFVRNSVEFGVSGMLVNSNLIMYDRDSDAWWPQILGTSVLGQFKGLSLHEFRVTWTTWERWTSVHPDTQVLTEDTGEAYGYVNDPYGSYNPREDYYTDDKILFDTMHPDNSHHKKETFIGARSKDGPVAFKKQTLRDDHLLETTVGDVPYLAAYHEDLDSAWVYRNTDEVTITETDGGYEGPDGAVHGADELPLESINAFDVMWFAWIGFYPESDVVA